MTNLDTLTDTIVADAMLDNGADLQVLISRGSLARPKKQNGSTTTVGTRWSTEEDQFLQDNLGKKPLGEIAAALGRSRNALKVHFTRQGYAAPSKLPGWISLTQAARMLGVEQHAVPGWFRRGIIPGRYAYTKNREIAIIKLADLKFWATRPHHWPYFNVENMPPGHLRRLVEKAQQRWGDQWLTTRQVGDMYDLNPKDILNAVYKGRLPAIRCPHIGGRDADGWAYWFIRKSDAFNYEHVARGQARSKTWLTPRAEAYLLTLIAQGKNSGDAARLMKQDQTYLSYRMCILRKEIKRDRQTD